MIGRRHSTIRAGITLLPFGLFLLLVGNLVCGGELDCQLMFQSPRLNALSAALTFALPAVGNLLVWRSAIYKAESKFRYLNTLLLAPLSALCLAISLLILLFSVGSIRTDRDLSFGAPDVRYRVPRLKPPVYVYESGDFIGDSILIQQERPISPLFPRLVCARVMCRKVDAAKVVITPLDSHHFRCVFPPSYRRERTDIVTLENP